MSPVKLIRSAAGGDGSRWFMKVTRPQAPITPESSSHSNAGRARETGHHRVAVRG